jgi:hypothetical protein
MVCLRNICINTAHKGDSDDDDDYDDNDNNKVSVSTVSNNLLIFATVCSRDSIRIRSQPVLSTAVRVISHLYENSLSEDESSNSRHVQDITNGTRWRSG